MVVIVTREYFESYLSGVYERIFLGRSGVPLWFGVAGQVMGGCFVDKSWEMALIPDRITFPGFELEALAAGARRVGDPDYIMTDISLQPPHQNNALISSWSRQELEYAMSAATLMFDSAMFGLSARWGVCVGSTSTPSCVGGDKEFMDAFFAYFGGREVAKKRFLAWADEEWELSSEHRPPILKRVWGD